MRCGTNWGWPESPAAPTAALGTGLRRYDGLERRCFIWRRCRSGGRTFASPSASSIRSSFRRRPESRTYACHRTTRPDRHPAAEAPPCAAPGTGLRRYDEASVVALCGACRSTTAGHTKPASKSHPLVIPAQAGIQNPRLPSHHPPRQAPCGRGPAMRCTGYRPSPVRRSQAKVLYLATVPLPRPNVRISQRKLHPLVIAAQAGIQNPRLPSHHPPRQAPRGRGLAMRCTG